MYKREDIPDVDVITGTIDGWTPEEIQRSLETDAPEDMSQLPTPKEMEKRELLEDFGDIDDDDEYLEHALATIKAERDYKAGKAGNFDAEDKKMEAFFNAYTPEELKGMSRALSLYFGVKPQEEKEVEVSDVNEKNHAFMAGMNAAAQLNQLTGMTGNDELTALLMKKLAARMPDHPGWAEKERELRDRRYKVKRG